MTESDKIVFGWKQALFLSLGVPLALLLALEGLCRVLATEKLLASRRASIMLEMPTWMQEDANTARRAAGLAANPAAVDWLNIFEQGQGFRVRLIPNISKRVTNTFSLVPVDKQRTYLVTANSIGFRGPDLAMDKPAGAYRILIFGDSSSFGWGVDQEETFSALLQSGLRDRFPGRTIEVGNFAIPGDSSEYGLLIVERFAAPFQPDLVVLGFGANDAKAAVKPHAEQVDAFRAGKTGQAYRYWLRQSALFRSLEAAIGRLAGSDQSKTAPVKKARHAVPPKRYQENLTRMTQLAKAAGAREVLLLTLCTPFNYAQRAAGTAAREGALFFDGQRYLQGMVDELKDGSRYQSYVEEMRAGYGPLLKQSPNFYVTSDLCHANQVGHRIIADRLIEIIAERGL